MKRYMSFFLVTVMLLSAGCPRAVPDAGKLPVRFSFWGNFKDFALWQDLITLFEEQHPTIRIKMEYIAARYEDKLPLQLMSGTAADVILMDDEIFPAYAVRGYLEDLRPYMERDAQELDLDRFLPTALESFNYRGFQGGMPWDGNVILIFYNKDMFDQAGIPYPEDGWTWNDFREISKRLTRDVDGDGRTDQFGNNLSFAFLPTLPLIWSFGADVLNADRTAFALDSPEGREALQFQYDMKYIDHSIAWTGELEGFMDEVMLLTGRVGMVMAGSYMMLTLGTVKDGMRWGLAHLPRGPRGDRYTRMTWDGISINRDTSTAKKEASWTFIKFLLSEESQAMIARSGRAMPVRREYVLKYYCRDDTPVREEVALEATEYGRLTPITPKYLELRQIITRGMDILNYNTGTVDDALALMKPEINAALRREIDRWGREGLN